MNIYRITPDGKRHPMAEVALPDDIVERLAAEADRPPAHITGPAAWNPQNGWFAIAEYPF